MAYNLNRRMTRPWDEVVSAVKGGLKDIGFGVLTEIDMQKTLKEKIGAEIGRYLIIGACNPGFANQAIAAEGRIGVLLPCNILVRELPEGGVEVVTVNPAETMSSVENASLGPLAADVGSRLAKLLESLA